MNPVHSVIQFLIMLIACVFGIFILNFGLHVVFYIWGEGSLLIKPFYPVTLVGYEMIMANSYPACLVGHLPSCIQHALVN